MFLYPNESQISKKSGLAGGSGPWDMGILGLVSRAKWMPAFSSHSERSFNIGSFKSTLSDMDSSRKENREVQKLISAWR